MGSPSECLRLQASGLATDTLPIRHVVQVLPRSEPLVRLSVVLCVGLVHTEP